MSPFGEIRSALDMLNLHVVKVDNIVPNTGIVPTMQTLLKNTVKTQVGVPGRSEAQMAGSFDVCRADLLALLQRQQEAVDALPLFSKPAPQPSGEPAVEPAAPTTEPSAEQPVVSAEPTAEPSVEQSVEPTTEQPAEQPVAEPEAEKGTEQPAEPVTSPAANPAPEPATKPAPEQPAPRASRSHTSRTSQLVKEVSAAVCTGVETLLRRCRTVSLDAPDPEGAYARVLRRRLGAALRTGDAGAEVRLLFVRRGPERAGDIPLYPGAEGPKAALRLPEAWEARMPKGAQREGVIAALLAAGRLQREEIAIDSA